ncbi:MAG: DeoR/GlpR family DNA-binding transcription regulator [Rhodoluna sp.]
MLAAQRHSLILQEIKQRSAARISDLAEALDVSEMTVRRDIELLAEQGLLEKVHGGATAVATKNMAVEPPFQSKSLREQLAKDAIAERAAIEIAPGSSIGLMGGSSVFAVAKLAVTIPGLTIVTNSLPVSDLFAREGQLNQTVVLAGGLRTPTDSFVGEITVAAFSALNLDVVFMGTHGMDQTGGFSTPNLHESQTNRAVISKARKLVVLADHTKWGEVGFSTFANLDEADLLITDSGISSQAAKILKTSVKDLAIVEI